MIDKHVKAWHRPLGAVVYDYVGTVLAPSPTDSEKLVYTSEYRRVHMRRGVPVIDRVLVWEVIDAAPRIGHISAVDLWAMDNEV